MAGDRPPETQLPPAPLASEEEATDERVSWIIVPLAIGVVLAIAIVKAAITYSAFRARSVAMGGLPSAVPSMGAFILPQLLYSGWTGVHLGLGAALGDRWLPQRWSRAARWSLAMGVGAILLNPSLVVVAQHLSSGAGMGRLLASPVSVWSALDGPLTAALLGLALGWAAGARRARALKLVGAAAAVCGLTGAAGFLVSSLYYAHMSQSQGAQIQFGPNYHVSLVAGPIAGALVGLVFAVALALGERRQLGRAAPRQTEAGDGE